MNENNFKNQKDTYLTNLIEERKILGEKLMNTNIEYVKYSEYKEHILNQMDMVQNEIHKLLNND